MSNLLEEFEYFKNEKSDINEHLQTLYDYGSECDHITEFGAGKSTFALAASNPKTFISYDIKGKDRLLSLFEECAEEEDVSFSYFQASTLDIEIEETDLLFIDTKHTYSQLKEELKLHAEKVKKYIILHDTQTFGSRNEFPNELPNIGLVPARDEFLKDNKNWIIREQFNNNNGLTVMERVS